jgi:hypothetical protein
LSYLIKLFIVQIKSVPNGRMFVIDGLEKMCKGAVTADFMVLVIG